MADNMHNEGTSSNQASGGTSENSIEINIKTLDSQTYTFQVERNISVETLKEKILDATGIPVGQQRLIFRGRVLKDDRVLSEYQLEDGHTLHLVERQPVNVQPTAGTTTQTTTGSNPVQGNGSSLPRNRIGQASHNVLLGSVNLGDQVDGGFADIGRLVGAVVHSLVTPVSNVPNAMASNPAAAGPAGGAQTASSRSQSRNPAQATGFAMHNHPIHFIPQISQFPPAVSLSRQTVIPDSLVTLSEFINRMNLAMQNAGPQSYSTNVQEPPRPDTLPPLNQRGLPTPEMLGSVIDQAQQLLSGIAAATFSHIASRLTREGASTDPVTRGQIQSEVMHAGLVMQHLGAMLLELGRTAMTIRMGDSPAESWVNAGPAVYISSGGPNPIMVQPFPQQTNSIFATSSLSSGLSGTSGIVDPSRNVNIHIHAGTSSATRMSSDGSNPGETHGEHTSAEQASASGNGLGNSAAQGLPSRSGHVISVVLPVQVRSQLSIGGHSGSSQGPMTGGSSFQPTATNPVPSIFTESDSLANFVTSIGARIANELGANTQGQSSSSSSSQSADSFGSHPLSNIVQSNSSDSSLQAHGASSVANYLAENLSYDSLDDNLSNVRERSEMVSQGSSATGILISSKNCSRPSDDNENCLGSSLSKAEDEELRHNSQNDSINARSCSTSQEASTSGSPLGTSNSLVDDTIVNKSAVGSTGTLGTRASASVSQPNQSDRPAPMGLGLGALQPKRRGKMAKPPEKPEQPRDVSSISENPHPVAIGQDVLRSLLSRGSDINRTSITLSSECQPPPVSDMANAIQQGGNRTSGQVDMATMMSHVLQSPAMSNLLSGVAEHAGVGSPDNLRGILEQCTQSPIVGNVLSNLVEQMEAPTQNIEGVPSVSGQGQRGINFSSMIQQMLPVVSQALSGAAQPQQTGRTSERHDGSSISNIFRDKLTKENVGEPSNSGSAMEKHSQILGGLTGSRQQVEDGENPRDVFLGTRRDSANVDLSSMIQGMMPLISQVLGSGAISDLGVQRQPSRNDRSGDAHDDLKNKEAEVDLIEIVQRIEQEDSPSNILQAELESAANLCGEQDCCDDLIQELGNNTELAREFEQLLKSNIHQKLKSQSDTKDKP